MLRLTNRRRKSRSSGGLASAPQTPPDIRRGTVPICGCSPRAAFKDALRTSILPFVSFGEVDSIRSLGGRRWSCRTARRLPTPKFRRYESRATCRTRVLEDNEFCRIAANIVKPVRCYRRPRDLPRNDFPRWRGCPQTASTGPAPRAQGRRAGLLARRRTDNEPVTLFHFSAIR